MAIKKKYTILFVLISLFLISCSSLTYALKANGETCSKWGRRPDGSYGPGDDECESGNCGVTDDYAVETIYICCAKDPNYSHNDCCLTNDDCDYPSMICKSPYYTCHWKCEYTTGGCCYKDSDCPSGYECDTYADTEWQFGECVGGGGGTPSAYCGDGSCNSGETCSSCSSDCGSCDTTSKANGEYCSLNYECDSGNCRNNICCENGRICCDDDNDCVNSIGPGRWCSTSDHFCYEPQSQDVCATVICKTGYKCVNGDCVSTGTKKFCQSCTDGSECASGACLTYSDGISRCGSTTSTVTCCGDGKGIENLQTGIDCCDNAGCDSGYICVNYKCIKKEVETFTSSDIKEIKCYAEDMTDGTIGSIGTYPYCSFDDTYGGNEKVDGEWVGSYTISKGEICLKISSLVAPGIPQNSLSVGYTVTLSNKIFEDGSNTKNFIIKNYVGNPGGIEEVKCFIIKDKIGLTSCGDGTCQSTENCYNCPSDCVCDANECCIAQYYGGGYSTVNADGCASHGEIIRDNSGERVFCAYGKLSLDATDTCVFDSHCKNNDLVRKILSGKYGRPVDDSEIVCVWKETYGVCDKKETIVETVVEEKPGVETASGRITNFVKDIFKFLKSGCASNLQCEDDEFCSEEWECKKLVCSQCNYANDNNCYQCEYAKNHQCNRYQCCSDRECGVLQKCDTNIHKCFERSTCTKIIDNGDSDSKIDVVFIDDDYFYYDDFKGDILKLVDYDGNNGYYGLMSIEPFKSEKEKFNIWIMEPEEDIPYKLNPWEPDPAKAREVAAKCPVSDYQIFVSKKANYRSFCFFGGPCFLSLKNGEVDTKDYDGKVLVHEFAHGFGRIADEYVEEPIGNRPKEPNCVSDKAQAEKLWGDLVKTQSGYGYYEGCSYTSNNIRPTPTSIMRYPYTANAEFYLVNERFIQTRLDMYK